MAVELEAVNNSFQEVKDCITQAQVQLSQNGMSSFSSWINPSEPGNASFFSSPCGLSCNSNYEPEDWKI